MGVLSLCAALLVSAVCPPSSWVSSNVDGVVLRTEKKPRAGRVLTVVFSSQKPCAEQPSVVWNNTTFALHPYNHGQWRTLLPLSADMPVGAAPLVYVCNTRTATFEIPVYPGGYPERALSVPAHFTEQAPPERAQNEQKAITAVWDISAPKPLWSKAFHLPGKGPRTSRFGVLRTYNGVKKSRHQGLDLDARVGSVVTATNDGVVAWVADNYYFVGNAVFLDHGEGLFSMVFHMSRVDVQKGDTVVRGQVLGLAGNTGRASGPHIHMGIKIKGTYIDPDALLCATAQW